MGYVSKEHAAAKRKEIRQAIKDGVFPKGIKISVRKDGSSLDASITAWEGPLFTREFIAHLIAAEDRVFYEGERYTEQAREVLAKLNSMVRAGQVDRNFGDPYADYPNCNFYASADFHWEMAYAIRARQIEEQKAEAAA